MKAEGTARIEYNEAQELENLLRVFERLDKKADKKIDAAELGDYLKFLGHKCKTQIVEEMIWEVDEDCDKCVNWEEFKAMFYRVRHDKSGWEPRRLFNVVEFMLHDKDFSGSIDMDECMEILFRRFGREALESKLNEFMANDEDGDQDITFSEFLHMDERNVKSGAAMHPSMKLAQSVVDTTRAENKKLIQALKAS